MANNNNKKTTVHQYIPNTSTHLTSLVKQEVRSISKAYDCQL